MELDEKPLISVIVPVYNTEPYLRKCLDSIIVQTYENLEILIIDDGSTDKSGRICDEYTKDARVKVFHTENRGLSAARNKGLDEANGDWIGFVDSDDWIDPDMYEILLQIAKKTGADIVECGVYEEYPGKTKNKKKQSQKLTGSKAVEALLREELSDNVWNKLWGRECFTDIRFPENRLFEDIVTTYRVFLKVEWIQSVEECKYHYLQRENGLSRSHSTKNLVDYWLAHHERYLVLKSIVGKEAEQDLFRCCACAAARAWAYYDECPLEDRNSSSDTLHKMNEFMRNNIPLFGCKEWNVILRIGCFFPHYYNALSFRMAWMLNRINGKGLLSRLNMF